MKFFQSRSAEKFSGKVRLPKVNQVCIGLSERSTTDAGSLTPFFNQGPVEIFASRFARKFLSKVRLEI